MTTGPQETTAWPVVLLRQSGSSHRVLSPSGFAPTGEAPACPAPFPLRPPVGWPESCLAGLSHSSQLPKGKEAICMSHRSRHRALEQARQAGPGKGKRVATMAVQGQMAQGPHAHTSGMGGGRREAGPSGLAQQRGGRKAARGAGTRLTATATPMCTEAGEPRVPTCPGFPAKKGTVFLEPMASQGARMQHPTPRDKEHQAMGAR